MNPAKLCFGNNNTRPTVAEANGACGDCTTDPTNAQLKNIADDDIITDVRGNRYVYVGRRLRQLCTGDNHTCRSLCADNETNLCRDHGAGVEGVMSY